MTRPRLWILAGPNGSGKSTYFEQRLKVHFDTFINADEMAKESGTLITVESSWQAKLAADEQRRKLLDAGASFCTETVLSHESWIEFMRKAVGLGYEVILIFICLDDPALNAARVQHRVSQGGHDVPMDRIGPRYNRSIAYCGQAIPLVDEVWLIDNTLAEAPFTPIARFLQGRLVELTLGHVPRWVQAGFAIHLPSSTNRLPN